MYGYCGGGAKGGSESGKSDGDKATAIVKEKNYVER